MLFLFFVYNYKNIIDAIIDAIIDVIIDAIIDVAQFPVIFYYI